MSTYGQLIVTYGKNHHNIAIILQSNEFLKIHKEILSFKSNRQLRFIQILPILRYSIHLAKFKRPIFSDVNVIGNRQCR